MEKYKNILEEQIIQNLNQIKQEFLNQIKRVWGHNDIEVEVVKDNTKSALMALGHEKIQQQAIKDILIVYPKHITLYIHEKAFELTEKNFIKILIHEALHIGYKYHDQYFKNMVEKYEAAYTEKSIDLNPEIGLYKIQMKGEKNFITIETFDDLAMAKEFAKERMQRTKIKHRIIY